MNKTVRGERGGRGRSLPTMHRSEHEIQRRNLDVEAEYVNFNINEWKYEWNINKIDEVSRIIWHRGTDPRVLNE